MATITLTEKALKEVKHIMAEQNMDVNKVYLRVGVRGAGCQGFEYSLNLDELYNPDKDTVEELTEGIKLVVDKRSAMYLTDVTLDFHDDLNKRGFKFENPHSSGVCGCGKSFSM